MRTSSEGVRFIAGFVGFVNHPYQDAVSGWTIGYGHTGPGVRELGRITPERGLQLLAGDLRGPEAAVGRLGLTLTQAQFDALVSIVADRGAGVLAPTADLGRALRGPDLAGVPAAMRRYTQAGGHALAGLRHPPQRRGRAVAQPSSARKLRARRVMRAAADSS